MHMQTHTTQRGIHTRAGICPLSKLWQQRPWGTQWGGWWKSWLWKREQILYWKLCHTHSNLYTNPATLTYLYCTVDNHQRNPPLYICSPIFPFISLCFNHFYTLFSTPTHISEQKYPCILYPQIHTETSTVWLQRWGHGGLSLHLRASETSSNSCLLLLFLPCLLLLPSRPSVIHFYFS